MKNLMSNVRNTSGSCRWRRFMILFGTSVVTVLLLVALISVVPLTNSGVSAFSYSGNMKHTMSSSSSSSSSSWEDRRQREKLLSMKKKQEDDCLLVGICCSAMMIAAILYLNGSKDDSSSGVSTSTTHDNFHILQNNFRPLNNSALLSPKTRQRQERLKARTINKRRNQHESITNIAAPKLSLKIQDTVRLSFHRLWCFIQAQQQLHSNDAIKLVPNSKNNSSNNFEKEMIVVNALVFEVEVTESVVLVILPSGEKVDTYKLHSVVSELFYTDISIDDVQLAPSDKVHRLCGYVPGTVPPIGHEPRPYAIIVDKSIIQMGTKLVVGGGGHPDWRCIVSVDLIVQRKRALVADVVKVRRTSRATFDNGHSGYWNYSSTHVVATSFKPFFPISPPSNSLAKVPIRMGDTINSFHEEFVTLVGHITGVRRMAKKLVFCDFAPPDSPVRKNSRYTANTENNDDAEYPWRSGEDGKDMAVQLIAGRTICETLGDMEGPAALRRLRPGLLVLIRAKTNLRNEDSLINWLNKRSLDLVVLSYDILEDDPPSGSSATPREHGTDQEHDTASPRMMLEDADSDDCSLPSRSSLPSTDPNSVQCLCLIDVLGESGAEETVTIVEDQKSIDQFAICLSQLLLLLTTAKVDSADDYQIGSRFAWIGIDCEWKPSVLQQSPHEPQPVLLLQVCVHPLKRVFLFDLQHLLRPLCSPEEEMTELESDVSEALTDLLLSTRLLKCGFQLLADLRRLSASYPHITAFQTVNAVVEVATLAKKVMHMSSKRNSRFLTSSLAHLTEYLLGKPLSKDQQVSDWSQRPLTKKQVEYAALDAAIAPVLVEKSMEFIQAGILGDDQYETLVPKLGRWPDDNVLASCVTTNRFSFLESENPSIVRKLRAKKIVGQQLVVTQTWITGQSVPVEPSAPVNGDNGPFTDVHGIVRIPSLVISLQNPITKSLIDSLIGRPVAKSKDRCLQNMLSGNDAIPFDSRLDFSQRSGYVEFKDAVALFVNMPDKSSQSQTRNYPNAWLDDGRILTWYLREHEWKGGESKLAKKLLQHDEIGVTAKSVVVLFVRVSKGPFLFCGRCGVEVPDVRLCSPASANGWGLLQLHLRLHGYKYLMASDAFKIMVE